MKIFSKIIYLTFAFFLLYSLTFLFFKTNLNALEITPEKFQLDMTINRDKSAEGIIQIEIKNLYSNKFITQYEFRLPIKNVSRLTSQFNGESVSFDTTSLSSNFPSIKVKLSEKQILRENQSGIITIFFSSTNVIQQRGSLSELYIPNPIQLSTRIQSFGMKVTVNQSVGDVIYMDKEKIYLQDNVDHKIISTSTPTDLLVIFGKELKFGMQARFQIVNDQDNEKKTLFNLFGNFYDIKYQILNHGDYGVVNKYGNNFAVVNIPKKDKIDVDMQASIDLSTFKQNSSPPKYNLFLDYDSDFFQTLNQTIKNNEMSFESKYKYINDKIKTNSRANKNLSINWESGADIWYKFTTGITALNAFESCYLIGSIAEFYEDEFTMYYGYILFPNFSYFDITKPHLWCEVRREGRSILMDPFLENISKLNYFDKENKDRITIGVAHPEFSYDPMLGLKEDNFAAIKISFIDFPESSDQIDEISAKLDVPQNVLSGEFFEGTLYVKNERNVFIIFTDILVNQRSEIGNIFVHKDLHFGLLPFQENRFQLSFLRELNIFFNGEKEFSIELISDQGKIVSTSQKIQFSTNSKFIYILLIIGISFFVILISTIRYHFRKNQIK